MRNWRLTRGPYWAVVVVLLVVKVVLVMGIELKPDVFMPLRSIDTGIMVGLAFAVAGRFADAGWPRWPAFVLIILISFVMSLVILIASGPQRRGPSFLDSVPSLIWLSTVALFALLIVAGVKRSAALPATPPQGAPSAGRIEPTM
jgi:hypothetical protein